MEGSSKVLPVRRKRLLRVFIGATSASFALLLGSLVYVFDRAPGSAAFLPAAWSLKSYFGALFGPLGGNLPALMHAFAFTVLTALTSGLYPRRIWTVTLSWAATLTVFELGQFDPVTVELIPYLRALVPIELGVDRLSRYFERGTFDPLDLAATYIGCTAGALFTLALSHRQSACCPADQC